ncbi:unnamed protein product [Fusarium graminearum]|uniref:Chromosome 4, complete genome n=1 Tax=Gibberella zeae (strain ATCC MYA-4620 / CBS 123657 / FGSC 9075 / NRRL 31084 / PH-1) TaxID=229533 RepID=A0A1C3YL20_GIBZE|nr:unnamed protein product [Fusarium graminearum]
MATESVHPLRINKTTTPGKSPSTMASGIPRPLSELSPTEMRRNSPSWHRQSNGSPKKSPGNPDSSPFQPSPSEVSSPRLFWQNRNTENIFGPGSPSSHRRSSIERLQKASRVKNSNILALEQKQEYDPTRLPQIERPLAKVQANSFHGSTASFRSSTTDRPNFGHGRSESAMTIPTISPTRSTTSQSGGSPNRPLTPSRDQVSPTKSSLSHSRFKNSFDMETGTWTFGSPEEEDDHPMGRRHAKSVTFDAAPPQVNEYEMATPDLSSIGTNSREGSYESLDYDEEDSDVLYDPGHADLEGDSFDASLEDTDKTPVVGPDDWRGDSPMTARTAPREFDGSPLPETPRASLNGGRPLHVRSDSTASSGEHRPLPPLPGFLSHSRNNSAPSSPASPSLSATAERMLGNQRNLPSPPAASPASKLDIQSIGNAKMTLEERLRLMMLSDDSDGKTAAEQQRERRLRRGNGRERLSSPISEPEESMMSFNDALEEQDDMVGEMSALEDYQLPPRISRDSIMRKVNGNSNSADQDKDCIFTSPPASRSPSRSPERQIPDDPDIPIPSTEDSLLSEDGETEDDEEQEGSVIIRRIPDSEIEFYEDSDIDFDEDESRLELPVDDDSESHYSSQEPTPQEIKLEEVEAKLQEQIPEPEEIQEDVTTPTTATPTQSQSMSSLLDIASHDKEASFSRDFESYMLPEPQKPEVDDEPVKEDKEPQPEAPKMADAQAFLQRPFTPEQPLSKPEYDGTGWGDPEDEYDDDCPSTPDSVIHHPVPAIEEPELPAIPERTATIKATGSKLKTRLSNTPSDLNAMREARRIVSMEVPDVPPIPDKHSKRLSRDNTGLLVTGDEFINRHPSFKNRSLTLDLDLGLSLDQDFERVIEAQKVAYNDPFLTQPPTYNSSPSRQVSATRTQQHNNEELDANVTFRRQRGYLMRQNTKVVTASDKDMEEYRVTRSVGNSPVKEDRPMSCIVEPWNGKPRQRSVRKRVGGSIGPVPPLPGQESNATAVSQAAVDDDLTLEMATPESGERGRLFVKVMGVKDLDLPLPKSECQFSTIGKTYLTKADERTWFSLTLDNGVHCVTTAWLELARNAPIGQEFELVVPNDLEFQLTLNVKLEKPIERARPPPPAAKVHKHKTSTFSRVFASPKKRKELELRQREEEERAVQLQKDAQAKQRNIPPTAYELLSPLAAEDGSFGRAYVCLREHETRCFGRPYLAEVACFNEWATEEAGFASSVKSKRGNTNVVRRAPYKVGKLELQLLFVPRPKNATDEDMPKSMNSCIRELKAAEERMSRNWEGHLSQQGGDCPYWRRRYFKLVGTKLTAYHEATRQPRATINLANAKRLIDDRRALTEKETTGRGGRRRRSAFAEDEEGYMFVEEGFRMRFNNGELIDFYADTAADKEGWMKVLTEVVGRDSPEEESSNQRSKAKWCQLVLRREEQLRRRASGRRVNSRPKSMFL